jgi:replicative DNA helicase
VSVRTDDGFTRTNHTTGASATYLFTPGGGFILDTDPVPKPLWGKGDQALLTKGESLIIAGPQGVGKTTLAQQLTLGRCGFLEYATLLGLPVEPGNRVLYLAMDRPKQAARSFRRMADGSWRAELDERLVVWQGPPPYDLAKYSSLLLTLCRQAGADTVIVDSLKDAAIGLSDDETGAAYNRARQTALAGGVQVIELHHIRKALSGAKAEHPSIDDIYGSTWLTSGAGSVILLNGAPGDPIVSFHHVKQPAEEVGPFKIIHSRDDGCSQVFHSTDLVMLAAQPGGLTAAGAAKAMFDTEKGDRNQKEKARNKLKSLEKLGLLQLLDPGDVPSHRPAVWGPR